MYNIIYIKYYNVVFNNCISYKFIYTQIIVIYIVDEK